MSMTEAARNQMRMELCGLMDEYAVLYSMLDAVVLKNITDQNPAGDVEQNIRSEMTAVRNKVFALVNL